MRIALFLCLTVGHSLASQTPAAPLPPLADSVIDAAIKEGTESKNADILAMGEDAGGFTGAMLRKGYPFYTIYVEGPVTRIRAEAALHARKYLPFTRDSLPDPFRYPYLAIRVVPARPRIIAGQMAQAEPITHVVLQQRGESSEEDHFPVLQPVTVTRSPVEWGNAMGATYTGEAATALFPMSAVPTSQFDVVVIHGKTEQRFRIKDENLAGIR